MSSKFTSIIIVTDSAHLQNAYKLYGELGLSGKKALILTPEELGIINKDFSSRSLSYYQDIFKLEYLEVWQKAYSFFYSLAEKEISGIPLKTLTDYKGVSLWGLSAQYVITELIPIFYNIEIAEAVLGYEETQEVYIYDAQHSLAQAFNLLCERKRIACSVIAASNNLRLAPRQAFVSCGYFLKRIKRLFLSLYFLLVNFFKSRRLAKSYKVIFFASMERFLFSMLPAILEYNENERLAINMFPSGASKKLRESKVFYTDLYGYKICALFDRNNKKFLYKIMNMINSGSFLSEIKYKELPMLLFLTGIFRKLRDDIFSEKIRLVDVVSKAILFHKPEVVVVSDCPFDIALIAKSLSLPVVSLQSMHPEDFIIYSPLVSDAVTVDGSFWKDYLINKNVDPQKIWVTGFSRFENIKNFEFDYRERNLLKGVYEDLTEKIVVFATSSAVLSQGLIKDHNLEHVKSVCRAMSNIQQAQLIIKLHPYDSRQSIYEKIAQEAGLSRYSIVKDVNMLKLLYHCDLLITHLSSVSYEAVLMDRNVIVLNSSSDFRTDDLWNFRKYDVVIFVEELAKLEDRIRDALFNPDPASLLKKNRQGYILDHAYKLDGKSSLRVKEVIDRLRQNNGCIISN